MVGTERHYRFGSCPGPGRYRPNGKRLDMMSSRMMMPRVVGGTILALALLVLVPGASSGAAGLSARALNVEPDPRPSMAETVGEQATR